MTPAQLILLALPLLSLSGCFFREAVQPAPAPPPPWLERISVQQALAGRQYFSAGMTVSVRRDEDGQLVATLRAAGQVKEWPVSDQADFYAVSHRADAILMHDHPTPLRDSIRVFQFSPAGVREKLYDHGPDGGPFDVRVYSRFHLCGLTVAVTEELAGSGRTNLRPTRRLWSIPLD